MTAVDFLKLLMSRAKVSGSSSIQSLLAENANMQGRHPQGTSSQSTQVQPIHGSVYRPNGQGTGSGQQMPGEQQQPGTNSQYFQKPRPMGAISQSHNLQQQQTQGRPGSSIAQGQAMSMNMGSQQQASNGEMLHSSQISEHLGAQTPNQVPEGQFYSTGGNRGESSSNEQSQAHPTPSAQSNTGVGMATGYNPDAYNQAQMYTNPMFMLSAGMGSNVDGKTETGMHQVQQPVQQMNTQTGALEVKFNPDQLMNSMLSTGTGQFDPDTFRAEQTYVSTSTWNNAYAGKPTGYSGMFVPDETMSGGGGQKMPNSPNQGNGQQGMQQQVSQNQYHANMNFAPVNMMIPGGAPRDSKHIKFDFDPDRINQFAGTFRPGLIAPLANGQGGRTSHNGHKPIINNPQKDTEVGPSEEKEAQEPEPRTSQAPRQQGMQQPGFHAAQMSPFNQFHMPRMNFMGDFPMQTIGDVSGQPPKEEDDSKKGFVPGKLYPGYREQRSTNEGSYSSDEVMRAIMANMAFFKKIFHSDVANLQQREERVKQNRNANITNISNVTTPANTTSTPTTMDSSSTSRPMTTVYPNNATSTVASSSNSNYNASISNITTAHSTSSGGSNHGSGNTGQTLLGPQPGTDSMLPTSLFGYGGPSGYNPNQANQGAGFNPAMSPGMTFSGMTFGQLGPSSSNGSSGGGNPFAFAMNGNFDPSKVNSAQMSFNMNAQMGIMGNGNGATMNGQNFNGGYDPIQTNIMAMQNPFSSNSGNGNSTNSHMTSYTGNNNAFIKPFDPDTVNQALMSPQQSGNANGTTNGNGGSFTSFYLGMGGSGGMGSSAGFGGSFDPSSVNTAVFNPDQVNNIRMHFDPSEMLERNPGYDKDTANSYNFDPNKVNQMQSQNFAPPFLGANNGGPPLTKSDNSAKADSFGKPGGASGFLPGLLTGGGNQAVMFNPNKLNNISIQMNPMGNSNQMSGNSNAGNGSAAFPFDPTAVNNMQMSFNPYSMMQGSNPTSGDPNGNKMVLPIGGKVHEFGTHQTVSTPRTSRGKMVVSTTATTPTTSTPAIPLNQTSTTV